MKLERRFANGYSYLVGYTFSRSKDTRSYDPAFTAVSGANNQSASSTPFDINNRDLNYALVRLRPAARASRRRPCGNSLRPGASRLRRCQPAHGLPGRRLDAVGQFVAQSGRPMTVYAGSNTFSNVVQTPANCDGCSSDFGSIHEITHGPALVWYFTPEERAKFSMPAPGEYQQRRPELLPRSRRLHHEPLAGASARGSVGAQILEIRADSTNVLNHPTFGFPTADARTARPFGRSATR